MTNHNRRAFLVLIIIWALTLMAMAIAVVLSIHARAQTPTPSTCGPTDKIITRLGANYGEAPIMIGTTEDGQAIFSLFVNPVTLTWTILGVAPNGGACVMASGRDYSAIKFRDPKGRSL